MTKTNEAVFSIQPMFEVFNPTYRRGIHAAPMRAVAPQAVPRQLNASFIGGAEAQHDKRSRALIDGLIAGAGTYVAWSAWDRYRTKGKHAK